MPEGDTVHLAARRLQAALAGRTLTRGELRVPSLAATDLAGRTVTEVVARGKHLLLRLDDGWTLHTHKRMDGSWHLYRHGDRWKAPSHQARVVLANDDWVAVGFRLPVVEMVRTAGEAEVVGHLGPDVLGDDWDARRAVANLAADPQRPVGAAILDQRNLAGPGNVYRSEALFLAGIHPATPVGEVGELGKLVDIVKRLMEANRDTGSQITTGSPAPGRSRWVYGRAGAPCRRCGTAVRRMDQEAPGGERVVFWCPGCQPAPVASRGLVRTNVGIPPGAGADRT